MESEKTKQSTSAAATTLGVAAMLSAVSNVFTGQTPSSIVSDSDTDDERSEAGSNVWNEENLRKSQVRSPRKQENAKPKASSVEPLFGFHQEGAWRDEIEVEIQTKNKKRFTGTITPTEAKHSIYIKALGFEDHSNFDGVRINFKGKLVVTFKLIQPINIDELDAIEHFDFVRTSTVNGKRFEDVIGCRIRGIRYRPLMISSYDTAPKNDGSKVVKIEGCEYRVTEDEILNWLSHYGEVTSKLEEDVFRDEVATDGVGDGTNRTGNYTVLMKLESPIPQLLPMCGRRVKIYHSGIQKLCTNCFGPHKKSQCTNEKIPWIKYVQSFIEENKEFTPEMFGKWIDIVQRMREETGNGFNIIATRTEVDQTPEQTEPVTREEGNPTRTNQDSNNTRAVAEEKAPTEEDFDIPTTKEAYESMIDKFNSVGISKGEADEAIKNRTTMYNRACREHKKRMAEKKKQDGQKPGANTRRNSIKKH
jgi:hypothetical protein